MTDHPPQRPDVIEGEIVDPRGVDPRRVDPRRVDQRGADTCGVDQRGVDQRGADTRRVAPRDGAEPAGPDDDAPMTVSEPAKVMRIGTMIKQLLEEVRGTQLDEKGRDRLREIYETSVEELAGALSSDLEAELLRLTIPFDAGIVPSEAELRVAQAQLVGWLEGLFHGIQATLFAQQSAARQQLEMMQRSGALPPGQGPGDAQQGGVYL